jgi:hypothetical protein
MKNERQAAAELAESVCCNGQCTQGRGCPMHRRTDPFPRLPMVFDPTTSNAVMRLPRRRRRAPSRWLTLSVCAAFVLGSAVLVGHRIGVIL